LGSGLGQNGSTWNCGMPPAAVDIVVGAVAVRWSAGIVAGAARRVAAMEWRRRPDSGPHSGPPPAPQA